MSEIICIIFEMFLTFLSSQGFSITVNWALAWLVPIRGEDPTTLSTFSMSGWRMKNSMAQSATALVLSSVEPTGSSSSTVKYPWSSFGRKLCGMSLAITKMPTHTMPKAANMRLECFMLVRTMRA